MLFKVVEGENTNIVDIIKRVNNIQSDILIYPLKYGFELNRIQIEGTGYFAEFEDLDKLIRFIDLFSCDYEVRIETVTKGYKQVIKCEASLREYLDAPVITISARR